MKIITEDSYCCDECDEVKGPLIEFTDQGYSQILKGYSQILICLDCLRNAVQLLISVQRKKA
jgi:hypothetical protein